MRRFLVAALTLVAGMACALVFLSFRHPDSTPATQNNEGGPTGGKEFEGQPGNHGTVVNQNGSPLGWVEVAYTDGTAREPRIQTSRDGSFYLPKSKKKLPFIEVSHRDYAVEQVSAPRGNENMRIVMNRPHKLLVHVTMGGRPKENVSLMVTPDMPFQQALLQQKVEGERTDSDGNALVERLPFVAKKVSVEFRVDEQDRPGSEIGVRSLPLLPGFRFQRAFSVNPDSDTVVEVDIPGGDRTARITLNQPASDVPIMGRQIDYLTFPKSGTEPRLNSVRGKVDADLSCSEGTVLVLGTIEDALEKKAVGTACIKVGRDDPSPVTIDLLPGDCTLTVQFPEGVLAGPELRVAAVSEAVAEMIFSSRLSMTWDALRVVAFSSAQRKDNNTIWFEGLPPVPIAILQWGRNTPGCQKLANATLPEPGNFRLSTGDGGQWNLTPQPESPNKTGPNIVDPSQTPEPPQHPQALSKALKDMLPWGGGLPPQELPIPLGGKDPLMHNSGRQRPPLAVQVNDQDGAPVAGVRVHLVAALAGEPRLAVGGTVSTDADGKARFPESGDVYNAVVTVHEKYAPAFARIADGADEVNLTVSPKSALQVAVTLNGRPMVGPTVRVAAVDKETTWLRVAQKTDAEGKATFPGLPAGTVRVSATCGWPDETARAMDKIPAGPVSTIGATLCLRGTAELQIGETSFLELKTPATHGKSVIQVKGKATCPTDVSFISYDGDTGTFILREMPLGYPFCKGIEVEPCFDGPLFVRAFAYLMDLEGSSSVCRLASFDLRSHKGAALEMDFTGAKGVVELNLQQEAASVPGMPNALVSLVPAQYVSYEAQWNEEVFPRQFRAYSILVPPRPDGMVIIPFVHKGTYRLFGTVSESNGSVRMQDMSCALPTPEVTVPETGVVTVELKRKQTP